MLISMCLHASVQLARSLRENALVTLPCLSRHPEGEADLSGEMGSVQLISQFCVNVSHLLLCVCVCVYVSVL